MQPDQYFATPAVTRYFDHIQSQPSVRKSADALAPAFSAVTFDFTNAPPAVRKVPEGKKKEKKPAAEAAAAAAAAAPVAKEAVATEKKGEASKEKAPKEKKEKKEKVAPAEGGKKEKGGKAPAAPAEDAGEPIPSMIDLRVGHIIDGM